MSTMDEEDLKLLSSLQNLELDTLLTSNVKSNPDDPNLNPFGVTPFRRRSKSLSSINLGSSCTGCNNRKNATVKHTTSFKRSKKIIRDPVLKFLKFPLEKTPKCDTVSKRSSSQTKVREKSKDKLFGQCSKHRDKDFKSLLDACEGLNLGSSRTKLRYSAPSFQIVRPIPSTPHRTTDRLHRSLPLAETSSNSSEGSPPPQTQLNPSSCSTQARMTTTSAPCDVTIDELASYFETSVHIPKKMSSMAEMMYI